MAALARATSLRLRGIAAVAIACRVSPVRCGHRASSGSTDSADVVVVMSDTASPFAMVEGVADNASAAFHRRAMVSRSVAINYRYAVKNGYNFAFAHLPAVTLRRQPEMTISCAHRARMREASANHSLLAMRGLRPPPWCKLVVLWEVASVLTSKLLLFVDSDAVLLKGRAPLHRSVLFNATNPNWTLSAYDDLPWRHSPINTGVLLMRNNAHMARILADWWDLPDADLAEWEHTTPWEQAAMRFKYFERYSDHINVVPAHGVVKPSTYRGSYVWHLAGAARTPEWTADVFEHHRAIKRIPRLWESKHPFGHSHQFSLMTDTGLAPVASNASHALASCTPRRLGAHASAAPSGVAATTAEAADADRGTAQPCLLFDRELQWQESSGLRLCGVIYFRLRPGQQQPHHRHCAATPR